MMALTLPHAALAALVVSVIVVCVHCHGTMYEPPSRGVMSKAGYPVPADSDPYGNNCGGIGTQYTIYGSKCGVCGDPYSQAQPRAHENGGTYGRGIIGRTYRQGQTIPVSVHMSAAHKGGVSFSLCPLTDRSKPAPEDCFDRYPVPFADGSTYMPLPFEWGNNYINTSLVLPSFVTCEQCVLRWKYRAGNNWGCNSPGNCCTGCGSVQEEFYACSDIAIRASSPVTQAPTSVSTSRPVNPDIFPPYVVNPPFQQSEQTVLSQFPIFPSLHSNSVQTPAPAPVNNAMCPVPFCRIVCSSPQSCPSLCPVSCRLF